MANYQKTGLLSREIKNHTVQGEVKIWKVGEIRTITTEKYPEGLEVLGVINLENNQEEEYWMNGGLRGQFKMASIVPNQLIEVTCLGKVSFGETEDGQPRFVNSYRIEGLKEA